MKYFKTYEKHGVNDTVVAWTNFWITVLKKELEKTEFQIREKSIQGFDVEYLVVKSNGMDFKLNLKTDDLIDLYKEEVHTLLSLQDYDAFKNREWRFVVTAEASQIYDSLFFEGKNEPDVFVKQDYKKMKYEFRGGIVNVELYAKMEELPEFRSRDFYNKMKEVLNHEIHHAYEDLYKQNITKNNNYNKGFQINMISHQLKGSSNPFIQHFSRLLYLSSDKEVNARVTQFYQECKNKNVQSTDDMIEVFIDSDHKGFYDDLKNSELLKEYLRAYKIYSNDDRFHQYFKDFINHIQKNDLLPDIAISKRFAQRPKKFLDYWDKKFSRIAEIYKRKCFSVYSRLIEEND